MYSLSTFQRHAVCTGLVVILVMAPQFADSDVATALKEMCSFLLLTSRF